MLLWLDCKFVNIYVYSLLVFCVVDVWLAVGSVVVLVGCMGLVFSR